MGCIPVCVLASGPGLAVALAKQKVNEVKNMLERSGCQEGGNEVPACHSLEQDRARVEGSGDGVWVKEHRTLLAGSKQAR